nr:MAG TPA: Eclosion hormone [Caudoviricetes sp.]
MEEEQCPCNDCFLNDCDYWDSRYCCRYCRWLHGEVTPNCEDCNPMDI